MLSTILHSLFPMYHPIYPTCCAWVTRLYRHFTDTRRMMPTWRTLNLASIDEAEATDASYFAFYCNSCRCCSCVAALTVCRLPTFELFIRMMWVTWLEPSTVLEHSLAVTGRDDTLRYPAMASSLLGYLYFTRSLATSRDSHMHMAIRA